MGGVSLSKLGREFDFFITAVKMIGVLLRRQLPTRSKSSTSENWVKFCLPVLSMPQCEATRCSKRYCLWLNNTGSTETEELGFYSSPVHSREQLLAIDVFLLSYCYCRFNAETLRDLCWKGIRISDDPDAIMTSTSSTRRSFYVHRAQIHRNGEPATSHSQSKGSNSHSNSSRSPLLKAEISDGSNECRKLCAFSPQLMLVVVDVTNQGEMCTGHITRVRHGQGERAATVWSFQTDITTP